MVTTILGILGKDHILANYQNCCRHLHPPPQHQQGLHSSNEVRCHSVSYPVTLETETSEVTEAPRYYCGWMDGWSSRLEKDIRSANRSIGGP